MKVGAVLHHLLFQFTCHCRCDLIVMKLLSDSIALKGNYFGYISRSDPALRSVTA